MKPKMGSILAVLKNTDTERKRLFLQNTEL